MSPVPCFPSRAADEFQHQAETLEMSPHHRGGGMRVAFAQGGQKRAMVRQMPWVVKALVLGRYVREPRDLRLLEHGDQNGIACASEQKPMKGVMRRLCSCHILAGDRLLKRTQRAVEFC